MFFRLFTLTVFSGSTRKTFTSCPIAARRSNHSSIAPRPSFKYCSIWSLEINCEEPSVSKELPPPSEGNELTSTCTPRSASILFWYSRRLSRRIVISPPESESERRASTMVLARASRKSAFSFCSGCFFFSGGISPEFRVLRTFCQSSASWILVILKEISSRFTFPFSEAES